MVNQDDSEPEMGFFERWAHDINPTILGRALKEYVAESNHNGWDGWDPDDQKAINRFLTDFQTYMKSTGFKQFERITSVNPI